MYTLYCVPSAGATSSTTSGWLAAIMVCVVIACLGLVSLLASTWRACARWRGVILRFAVCQARRGVIIFVPCVHGALVLCGGCRRLKAAMTCLRVPVAGVEASVTFVCLACGVQMRRAVGIRIVVEVRFTFAIHRTQRGIAMVRIAMTASIVPTLDAIILAIVAVAGHLWVLSTILILATSPVVSAPTSAKLLIPAVVVVVCEVAGRRGPCKLGCVVIVVVEGDGGQGGLRKRSSSLALEMREITLGLFLSERSGASMSLLVPSADNFGNTLVHLVTAIFLSVIDLVII
jgi:hypothetical protein